MVLKRFGETVKKLPRWVLVIATFLFSLCGTVSSYRVDLHRRQDAFLDIVARAGVQLASQTEGLILQAKLRSEKDPLGWALFQQSQAPEPRFFSIQKLNPLKREGATHEPWVEITSTKSGQEKFEFLQWIVPEEGLGIKIGFEPPYEGFLGSSTMLENDLLVGLMLSIQWFLWILVAGRWTAKGIEPDVPAPEKQEGRVDQSEVMRQNLGGAAAALKEVLRANAQSVDFLTKFSAQIDPGAIQKLENVELALNELKIMNKALKLSIQFLLKQAHLLLTKPNS